MQPLRTTDDRVSDTIADGAGPSLEFFGIESQRPEDCVFSYFDNSASAHHAFTGALSRPSKDCVLVSRNLIADPEASLDFSGTQL